MSANCLQRKCSDAGINLKELYQFGLFLAYHKLIQMLSSIETVLLKMFPLSEDSGTLAMLLSSKE